MRAAILALLFAAIALADNFKLYLKEGGHHIVREYQVLTDRVRYYSIERSDWEELPLEMVDLKKTEAERKSRVEEEKKLAAFDDAEEKFDREAKREIARIPVDPGVYFVNGEKVLDLKAPEVKMVKDRKRSILKAMSPLPVVNGKAKLEITGEQSAVTIAEEKPNLYFRIADMQRFTIIRLKPGKGAREVGTWLSQPVTNLIAFEMDMVDVFRQQLKDDLYKVWPTKPLTPGEYALVQYVEGEGQIQLWDFRVTAP